MPGGSLAPIALLALLAGASALAPDAASDPDGDRGCAAPYYAFEMAQDDEHLEQYLDAQCEHDAAFAFQEFVKAREAGHDAAHPTPDIDALYVDLANQYIRQLAEHSEMTFPGRALAVPPVVYAPDDSSRLAYTNGDGRIYLAKHLPFASDLIAALSHELSHIAGLKDESMTDLATLDLLAKLANDGDPVAGYAVSSRYREYMRWFYLDLYAVEHEAAFDEDTLGDRQVVGAYVDVPASILVYARARRLPPRRSPRLPGIGIVITRKALTRLQSGNGLPRIVAGQDGLVSC